MNERNNAHESDGDVKTLGGSPDRKPLKHELLGFVISGARRLINKRLLGKRNLKLSENIEESEILLVVTRKHGLTMFMSLPI